MQRKKLSNSNFIDYTKQFSFFSPDKHSFFKKEKKKKSKVAKKIV